MPVADLAGITVVDHTTLGPGPYCSGLLARLGARVLKFEPPGGDPARAMPRLFQAFNAGKRSVVVDLGDGEARAWAQRAARHADVFIQSWRPGVAERLGLGAAELRGANRRLVYCSMSGYGPDGSHRDRPGQDITYLAASGALRQLFGSQAAQVPGLPLADTIAGLHGAMRIVSALLTAERTGLGQTVLISVAASLVELADIGQMTEGTPLDPSAVNPAHGVFVSSDGAQLTLGLLHEDRFWGRLCSALELGELGDLRTRERASRAAELHDTVTRAIRGRTQAELEVALGGAEIPWSPVEAPGSLTLAGGLPPRDALAPELDADAREVEKWVG